MILLNRFWYSFNLKSALIVLVCLLWSEVIVAEPFAIGFEQEPLTASQQPSAVQYLSSQMEADLQSYLSGSLHKPFDRHYEKVNKILKVIENGITKSSNDPKWWYYKSLAHRALAYIRFQELKGKQERFSDEQRRLQLAEQVQSQRRVLELDNEDMPTLSLKEYDTLASGVNDEARINVYQRMLKYPADTENEKFILTRIEQEYATTLEQLGRFDEASLAYAAMGNKDGDLAVARLEPAQASQADAYLTSDNTNDRNENLEQPNVKKQIQSVQHENTSLMKPPQQIEKRQSEGDKDGIPFMWYVVMVLIGGLLVLLWVAYFLVIRVKNFWKAKKEPSDDSVIRG